MTKEDFVKELGYLGVTARLKRLSDGISSNIRELYKHHDYDLEASWHLVFLYLEKIKVCSMTELADALKVTTPAILKVCKKMADKGYLKVDKNPVDKRKNDVSLTEKSLILLPSLHIIWQAGQQAIHDVLQNNPTFMTSLEQFEFDLKQRNFLRRTTDLLR